MSIFFYSTFVIISSFSSRTQQTNLAARHFWAHVEHLIDWLTVIVSTEYHYHYPVICVPRILSKTLQDLRDQTTRFTGIASDLIERQRMNDPFVDWLIDYWKKQRVNEWFVDRSIDWLIDWLSVTSYVFVDFRTMVDTSRTRRKAFGERRQYNDYPDYYDQYGIKTHQPPSSYRHTAPPPPPFIIKCYSCYYRWKLNEWAGMKGCAESFSPVNIPIVNCSGPCGVTRLTLTIFFTINDRKWFLNAGASTRGKWTQFASNLTKGEEFSPPPLTFVN